MADTFQRVQLHINQIQKVLYKDGDVEEASKVLTNATSDYKIVNYEVKNSTLYATGVSNDDDNVKVWAIKMKKAKLDTVATAKDNTDNKDKTTDNVDAYVAIKDDDFDQDVVNEKAYSIDADGNTWVLDKGKVYKSTGSDFKEMYTCDRALDRLDVYDDNNLMIWKQMEMYTLTLLKVRSKQMKMLVLLMKIRTQQLQQQDGTKMLMELGHSTMQLVLK